MEAFAAAFSAAEDEEEMEAVVESAVLNAQYMFEGETIKGLTDLSRVT